MKILIVALDNLGDAVMASSVLKPLKRMFPQSKLGIWVKEYVAGLFVDHSLVDVVHASDPFWDNSPGKKKGGLRPFIQTWNQIRKSQYDMALVLNAEWRRVLFCELAGIQQRVGYRRKKSGFFLSAPFPLPEKSVHFIDEHRELLENKFHTSILAEDCLPRLEVSPSDDLWWQHWSTERELRSKQFTVLHLFSGDLDKNWPLSCWAELIERSGVEKLVILCGPGEESKLEPYREIILREGSYLLAAPTLGQLKVILGHARLVVGGDSGPEHVAAAMGTSVLSLFGPTDPTRSRPLGRGDLRVLKKNPVRNLYVDDVIQAIADFSPRV